MASVVPDSIAGIARPSRAARAGLGRLATRRYLRGQLQQIDKQIEALIDDQTQMSWLSLERAAWTQPAAAEIVWTNRLELYYLHAIREAVLETLAYL